MKRVYLLCCSLCLLYLPVSSQPQLELELLISDLFYPVGITHANDDRLFIIERAGRIRIIDEQGQLQAPSFLDINDRVQNAGGQSEQGLLGLAFHPQYADNGYFYVHYIGNDNHSYISRFQVSASNSNLADSNSETQLLFIAQPYLNHNGGHLAFGPDGYLYIGMGDGGSSNDPQLLAQNPQTLHGKMLRIDVDNGSPYTIPPDNPYAEDDFILDEIWAIGLRNPWRFSFDRLTGDLWIGDVGQTQWEEINFEAAGSPGGLNFGWRCFEGTSPHLQQNCLPDSSFTAPLWQYDHQGFTHCSVTGGFVYRGSDWPGLYGQYLYADFCSGQIWSLQQDINGTWSNRSIGQFPSLGITTFGEDQDGELYLASLGEGSIYKIGLQCDDLMVESSLINESCAGQGDGAVQLEINSLADTFRIAWSDGSTLANRSALSAGEYSYELIDSRACHWRDTLILSQGTPSPPTIQAMGATSFCEGDFVDLSVSAVPTGYELRWILDGLALGNDELLLRVEQSGQYRAYFEGECQTDTSNSISIEVLPIPRVELAPIMAICPGDTINLSALSFIDVKGTEAALTSWHDGFPLLQSNELTSPRVTPMGTQTYYLRFMDGQQRCEYVDSIRVEVHPQTAVPEVILSGDTLRATAGFASYQWFWNGAPLIGELEETLVVSADGDYHVAVLDENGCGAASQAINVLLTASEDLERFAELKISPNPFTDWLSLIHDGLDQLPLRWRLIDCSGRSLRGGEVILLPKASWHLELAGIAKGLYFLELSNQDGVKLLKIIRQ